MKKILFTLLFYLVSNPFLAQDNVWGKFSGKKPESENIVLNGELLKNDLKLFTFNHEIFRKQLFTVVGGKNIATISVPNLKGELEYFEIYESSNFDADLQSRYPEIRAFSGKGITDKTATLKITFSPYGLHAIVNRLKHPTEYISPYSEKSKIYAVFTHIEKKTPWTCLTEDEKLRESINEKVIANNHALNSRGNVKIFRLAVSVSGEYSNYFGATLSNPSREAIVLSNVNATLSFCNDIFERDLAIHLNLVSSSTRVFYYDPANDPYTPTGTATVQLEEVQLTLRDIIQLDNYDIGHLFKGTGLGGVARRGGVCQGELKGRALTGPVNGNPSGPVYDRIVAHEMGHQFGATHTFSHTFENNNTNIELGTGITVMSYAGNTTPDFNIVGEPIKNFHAKSVEQIESFLSTINCEIPFSISNSAPNILNNTNSYNIPKSTPFILNGIANDPNGDYLTYSWEQMDAIPGAVGLTAGASFAFESKYAGPNFISLAPSNFSYRLFPKLETILAGGRVSGPLDGGNIGANSEALPSVSRILNFRLTVRDNVPYSTNQNVGQTSFYNVAVNVSNNSGPFEIINAGGETAYAGTLFNVTWNVNNTNNAPVSCTNVKISLSVDGGYNFTYVLTNNTQNDGNETLMLPNNINSSQCRIKVEAIDNIFFDISNGNFSIIPDNIPPTAPTLTATKTTFNSTFLNFTGSTDNIGILNYEIFVNNVYYSNSITTSFLLTNLNPSTVYSISVRTRDLSGNGSVLSNIVSVKTSASSDPYCYSNSDSANYENIGSVNLGTINNVSSEVIGYENFTNLSTNLMKGTLNTITIGIVSPNSNPNTFPETLGVWIDYNRDNDFDDLNELVYSKDASPPMSSYSGTFTIPTTALVGNTRMRVSMSVLSVPTPCQNIPIGQVEDYTVNIIPDTIPPSQPSLSSSNITSNSANLYWTQSTDNIGVVNYDIYKFGVLMGSTTSTSYLVSGLFPDTTYSFTIKAKDAAGNSSIPSQIYIATSYNDISYCPSGSTYTGSDYISRVQIGTINNSSSFPVSYDIFDGYQDFTNLFTNINKGSQNTIKINSYSYPGSSETFTVWIDYNRDGDFQDQNELVFSLNTTDNEVIQNFTVPLSSLVGKTRMRISMEYSAAQTLSCEGFDYGEVEDYTINIIEEASLVSVFRYQNTSTLDNDYLFSSNNNVSNAYGYNYNNLGITFKAYNYAFPESVPIHRYYNLLNASYIYTDPYYFLNDVYYTYEGIAFYAFRQQYPGTIPIYRFYNDALKKHHYTTESNFYANGYQSYGVSFYVFSQDYLSSNEFIGIDCNKTLLYPNPTNDKFIVENSTANIDSVIVVDLFGKTVARKEVNETKAEIDLSNCNSGIYLVKVKLADKEEIIKVIRQ